MSRDVLTEYADLFGRPVWQAIEHERMLARIATSADHSIPTPAAAAKLPGDPRGLRGIPVVGVAGGMGGAIKGTRPGDGLE